MNKEKSKFLTFCFSLFPGAGHMYMGFMKMGVSLMGGFLFLMFLSSWLDIGPLLYVLPLFWFYSFFDCVNKRYLTNEEFSLLEDKYLFSLDELLNIDKGIFNKHKPLSGIILVLLGVYLIWNNILHSLDNYIPHKVYTAVHNVTQVAPQILVGIAIIAVGAKLIIGKKRECDMND